MEASDATAVLAAAGTRPLWFRGGTVITMDPEVPDLLAGDVLVDDRRIVAVGPDLSNDPRTAGAFEVDCADLIVMPGLVDAHRHAWQTAFRRIIADADLDTYVASIHGGMAMHYTPDDMRVGSLASALSALDGGVTTFLDFSHNSRSRAHVDAVLDAYDEAGARVVHASAAPNAGAWEEHWPQDLGRLVERSRASVLGLTTVRMGLDIKRVWTTEELLMHARALGVAITFDGVLGPRASDELTRLSRQGLLGPDVTLIHCTDLSDEVWAAIADQEVKITLATTSDEHIGIATGIPPVQRCLDLGLPVSLSTDTEATLAGDMFTQMRTTLATQRMMVAGRRFRGEFDAPPMLTNRDALTMATVNGADHIGLSDAVGRLAPGLQADLLLVRANTLANIPFNSAMGTVVQGIDSAAVEAVFVAGRPRKWARVMIGVDARRLQVDLEASRDRIAAAVGWKLDPLSPPSFGTAIDSGLQTHVAGAQTAAPEVINAIHR